MKYVNIVLEKYKNLPVAVKASVVYLLVSLIQKGLGFITSPIYTRILTSDEYGQVAVFLSYEQLLGTLAMFCLSAGCFDVGMQTYKNDRNTFTSSMLFLSNCITIIVMVVCVILYPILGEFISISPFLIGVMFISFFFQPALTFWSRHERYEYKYKKSAIITISSAILSSVCAIVFILIFKYNNIYERIVGGMIPLFIFYICFYIYVWKRAKCEVNIQYVKFAFLFNLPLIPHYLSTYILNSSDRLMISNLRGDSEAGYYSLAYSLSAIILLLWSSISSSLTPYVMDKYDKKEFKEVSKTIYPILLIFGALCMLVVLMAPEIILLLGTKEYSVAVYVIPPIAGGVFFQALYYVLTDLLYYYRKQKYVLFASIVSAGMNIFLNFLLIPKFGFVAAGYTTLICYLIQAIIDYCVSHFVIKVDIIKTKDLIVMILIVISIIVLSNILYRYTCIRYIVVVGLILLFIIKRDKIKSIIFPK